MSRTSRTGGGNRSSVAKASDSEKPGAILTRRGSNPRCGKVFFSQSQSLTSGADSPYGVRTVTAPSVCMLTTAGVLIPAAARDFSKSQSH